MVHATEVTKCRLQGKTSPKAVYYDCVSQLILNPNQLVQAMQSKAKANKRKSSSVTVEACTPNSTVLLLHIYIVIILYCI